jgi:hypothetical protein
LHSKPLFDEILRLCADFEFESFVKKLDILEKPTNSKNLLSGFEFKVAEGKETASVVGSSLEIFDGSELIEEPQEKFVGALLRYIFDKHFLPHLLLRAHCISS